MKIKNVQLFCCLVYRRLSHKVQRKVFAWCTLHVSFLRRFWASAVRPCNYPTPLNLEAGLG